MKPWKYPAIRSNQLMDVVLCFMLLMAGLFIYFITYNNFPPYFVNDTGVELLQVRNFEPWPIKGFIPPYFIGDTAPAEKIEVFYGYFMQPFIRMWGDGISVFRLAIGLCFASTTPLFFILLRRMVNLPVAILGAVVYVTSAYTVWWPLLLLRNTFSPLLFVFFVLSLLSLKEERKYASCMVVIASLLAINTYTSFRAIIPAFLLSALLVEWLVVRNKAVTKKIFIVGICILILQIIFYVATGTDKSFLWRGSYVLDDNNLVKNRDFLTYLNFFTRSFLLPVYNNSSGFLADPTHVIFGRPILSVWLFGFWILGLLSILFKSIKKDKTVVFFLLGLLLSLFVLCIGGPSLKVFLPLAPVQFIILAYGINLVFVLFKNNVLVIFACCLFCLFVAYTEKLHMFERVKEGSLSDLGATGQDIGLFLKKYDSQFDYVIYGAVAIDGMRLMYPSWKTKSEFAYDFEEIEFENALIKNNEKYDRLWIVLSTSSPAYAQLEKQKEFCIVQNISNRPYATLLARCKNKVQPFED